MKKYLSLFLGCLIVLLTFVAPGNSVKAEEQPVSLDTEEDDCTCHDVSFLTGSERNKIVSNLLKTEEFKKLKKDLNNEDYKWDGANAIEIIKHNVSEAIMVGVSFTNKDEVQLMIPYIYFDGIFIVPPPSEEPPHEHAD